MPAEVKKEIQLEIAHVLFIDIVGYSKPSINEQHAAVEGLGQIVRASEQLQRAEALRGSRGNPQLPEKFQTRPARLSRPDQTFAALPAPRLATHVNFALPC
jgi:hypothetical protein